MSSFLFNTTLLLLTLLSFSSAFLIDLDGDEITNGGEYYIVVRSSEEGLTYTQKNDGCPLYIATDAGNYLGTPVRISSPLRKAFLSIEDRVTLAFVNLSESTPCAGSLMWKQTLNPFSRKAYITTGGSVSELASRPFKIVKKDRSLATTFLLQYCGSSSAEAVCSNVGLFESGLLGITQPAIISFKKVFTVLQMSTS